MTNNWIKCSERMPELTAFYRVTISIDDNRYFDIAFWDDGWQFCKHSVIAWMEGEIDHEEPYEGEE